MTSAQSWPVKQQYPCYIAPLYLYCSITADTVILLQIVMVSPGTHESLSRTNESSLKKKWVQNCKMLGPLCNQTVSLNTDSKTLFFQYTEIKI